MKSNIVVLVSVFTLTACATAFSGFGSGTESDPYIITTVEQLQEIQQDSTASYVLGNDIDASATSGWNEGAGFIPIGLFNGHFNGDGHVISDLYINKPNGSAIALFSYVANGGFVENVGIINAQIFGDYYVGTLAGVCCWDSLIDNCWASGEVTILSDGTRDSKSGGLLGELKSSVLSRSYSDVNVTALSSRGQIGGLCGYLRGKSGTSEALIENCYSTGTVISNGYKVGGLLGDADGINAIVSKCYSVGKVIGYRKKGLVGYNFSNPKIRDSYWDVQASECSSSYGGTGKTTAQMIQQSTFVHWDFENIWTIDEGRSYPYLWVPGVLESLEIVGPGFTVEDSSVQYNAIAHFDNGSMDVTASTVWSVGSNNMCQFNGNGLLTISPLALPEEFAMVYAEYSFQGVSVQTQKGIEIHALCPQGSALKFDGLDDYIEIPGYKGITGSASRTCMAWIKTDFSNDYQVIMSWGKSEDGKAWSVYVQSNGKLGVSVFGGNFEGTSTVNDGQWHHIAAILDDEDGVLQTSDIHLYVDGTEEGVTRTNGTDPGPNINTSGDMPVTIGVKNYGGFPHDWTYKYYFNGLIDDVRIYNRALTAAEIEINMYGLAGSEAGLTAYWNFDEGQEQVVYDLTGNANHGHLGFDPEGADDSDPVWVLSDAPNNICSLEGFVERNLNRAIVHKQEAIESLTMAIEDEANAKNALNIAFTEGEYAAMAKGDIVKTKQKIHSAIQAEKHAQDTIEISIEQLADIISDLWIE